MVASSKVAQVYIGHSPTTGEMMYWFLHYIFVCDVGSKERFGTLETIKMCAIIYNNDLSRPKWGSL